MTAHLRRGGERPLNSYYITSEFRPMTDEEFMGAVSPVRLTQFVDTLAWSTVTYSRTEQEQESLQSQVRVLGPSPPSSF